MPAFLQERAAGESEEQYSARLAADLEATIQREGPDTIAAMFVEAVMGAGGAMVPPRGYFEAITAVLDRYGITLVDDEVICGFGRTGNAFGCQTMNYSRTPCRSPRRCHRLCADQRGDAVARTGGDHRGGSHEDRRAVACLHLSAHPVAAAVALKTLEIYERRDTFGHVKEGCAAFPAAAARP